MIHVQTEDFDPGKELEQMRVRCHGKAGAIVSFTGLVRDLNEGEDIQQLSLEHYPGMTEKALVVIEAYALANWALTDAIIIHRVGLLSPNDRIVFIAAAAEHRKEAFSAVEYMIDVLKTDAPFWKKETTQKGEHWVHDIVVTATERT